MDPVTGVGLAASAAQLAEVVFKVFSNLYKYYRDVKSAPANSEQLRHELDTMVDLLGLLQESLDKNRGEVLAATFNTELKEFESMLRTMLKRTTPDRTVGIQRLKWPFKTEENARYIARIERIKSSLSLVMNTMHT